MKWLKKLAAWYVVALILTCILIFVVMGSTESVNPMDWHPGARALFLVMVPFLMGPPD